MCVCVVRSGKTKISGCDRLNREQTTYNLDIVSFPFGINIFDTVVFLSLLSFRIFSISMDYSSKLY